MHADFLDQAGTLKMANVFSLWWQYLALEGGVYAIACVVSIMVAVLLYRWYRRTKLFVAGEQLIRAGKILIKEGEHSLRDEEFAHIFETDGKLLEKIGNYLCSENKPYNKPINFELSSNDNLQVRFFSKACKRHLKHYLKNAISQLDDDNMKEKLSNLINQQCNYPDTNNDHSCSISCFRSCCVPPLLSLYRVVFQLTVKEVVTSELDDGQTQHVYLFGGYKCRPGSWWKLHAYFMSVLWIICNIFVISFIDNAFYQKGTICNDPNFKDDDFLCFDMTQSIYSEATNCSDPANYDVKVICYRASYNIANAISLATGLAHFTLLAIQVSFLLTLWFVKKCGGKFARGLNWTVVILCAVGWGIYFTLTYTVDDWMNMVEINIFYGYRLMRLVMVVWGLVTLLLVAIFSPYTWLTVKRNSEETYHYPSYNRADAPLCAFQAIPSTQSLSKLSSVSDEDDRDKRLLLGRKQVGERSGVSPGAPPSHHNQGDPRVYRKPTSVESSIPLLLKKEETEVPKTQEECTDSSF